MDVTHIDDRRQRTSAPDIPVAWIRPRQFARATGMGSRKVYDELVAGRLRGVQAGKCWHIEASEITGYFDRNGKRVAA